MKQKLKESRVTRLRGTVELTDGLIDADAPFSCDRWDIDRCHHCGRYSMNDRQAHRTRVAGDRHSNYWLVCDSNYCCTQPCFSEGRKTLAIKLMIRSGSGFGFFALRIMAFTPRGDFCICGGCSNTISKKQRICESTLESIQGDILQHETFVLIISTHSVGGCSRPRVPSWAVDPCLPQHGSSELLLCEAFQNFASLQTVDFSSHIR